MEDLQGMSYNRFASGRVRSQLPSSAEAEALYDLDSDLFTAEAMQGMQECVHAFIPLSIMTPVPSFSTYDMAPTVVTLAPQWQ